MKLLVFLALLLVAASYASIVRVQGGERRSRPPIMQNRPVIGIITQPYFNHSHGPSLPGSQKQQAYLAASYVKYVESAGARVVPIFHWQSAKELTDLYGKLNGVLFPGGGANLTYGDAFTDSARLLYNLTLSSYDNGDYVPLWGTCMGFEMLTFFTSNMHDSGDFLSPFDAENISLPLRFVKDIEESRLFADAPHEMISWLEHENLTMNNHAYGLAVSRYAEMHQLNSFYSLLSWNFDRKGSPFVSTVEGREYPVYATQWHPEKNIFEWTEWLNEGINHSSHAIRIAQYTADFFVDEARRNTRQFPDIPSLQKALIYNYSPVYSGLEKDSGFEQIYVWDIE